MAQEDDDDSSQGNIDVDVISNYMSEADSSIDRPMSDSSDDQPLFDDSESLGTIGESNSEEEEEENENYWDFLNKQPT